MLTTLVFPILLSAAPQEPQFEAPVRLKSGDSYVHVEHPGYANPSWFDVDGDGKKDLVVGQFKSGKIKIYRNLGDGKLDEGKWLEAGGKEAQVPDVW